MQDKSENSNGENNLLDSSLLANDLSTEEISLFQLKYSQETLLSEKTAAKSAFSLINTINYDEDIRLPLSAYRRPLPSLWSLTYLLSDNTNIYVIFTPNETMIWSSETDRETARFKLGCVERNKAVLIDCDSDLSLVAYTQKSGIVLVSNVFDPEIFTFPAETQVTSLCALDRNKVLIIYSNRTVSIFDAEKRIFENINYPFYQRLNFFRNPIINESIILVNGHDKLYGVLSGYLTVFDLEYQPVKTISIPSGRPVSATMFDDTIYLTNDRRQVIRILNVNSEESQVTTQELDESIDLTHITAISNTACIVCSSWSAHLISFSEFVLSLRCSDTFDNFIIGIYGSQDTLRVLTTSGGLSRLFIANPENSIPLLELLRSVLRQFIHGQNVFNVLRNHNISLEVFNELDTQFAETNITLIKERLAVHRELYRLAGQYFGKFDTSFFSSNHFKMSIFESALNDDFGELSDLIRSAAQTSDISSLFNFFAGNPQKFAPSFLRILERSMDSMEHAGFETHQKHNFVAETASFEAALIACLQFCDVRSDTFCGLVRIYALTQPSSQIQIMRLFEVRSADAERIAIEAECYTAIAEMSHRDCDYNRFDRCYQKHGDKCVKSLISYYADREVPYVSDLLEVGKFHGFRKSVQESLSFDESALAFHYIQESGADFVKSANLFYEYVRANKNELSVSQAASLLAIANLCVIATERKDVAPLRRKIENRLTLLELQKVRGLGALDILDSNDLVKHFMKMGEQGTTLSVIAATFDDRNDDENGQLYIDAIMMDANIGEKNLTQLLEATGAAAVLPKTLKANLEKKIKDVALKTTISNAFTVAHKNIVNSTN
ncbi:WD40 repeat-like family [Trichomonas vaginalis G3]|nr:WD40 repeat-like family [Trichomonas vaginalis G3]KAI5488228.1 WD40 repeat-like family [Trichomonas vaginalis G3]